MVRFIIVRIINSILILFIISIVNFIIIQLPPGDYVTFLTASSSEAHLSADQIKALRKQYGLDKPYYIQYFIWIKGLLHGDLGRSFEYNIPVAKLIGGQQFELTLIICALALLFAWLFAVPAGIYSAVHQYSVGDNILTVLGFLGLAIPHFLLALFYLFVATFWFHMHPGGLFSSAYLDAPWSFGRFVDLMQHIWPAVLIVGAGGTAQVLRIMRGNLLDILNQPYIQTARAKGVKESIVIYKHAVRIAINPLISLFGMQFPSLVGGVIITAIVLNMHILGPIYYGALTSQDMYVSGAILMFIAVLLIGGNFLADLLLMWVDPRIRYGQ